MTFISGLEILGGVMIDYLKEPNLTNFQIRLFSFPLQQMNINQYQGERVCEGQQISWNLLLRWHPTCATWSSSNCGEIWYWCDGILSVIVVDKGIGKKQDITITGTSTLPSEKVCFEKNCCYEECLVFVQIKIFS